MMKKLSCQEFEDMMFDYRYLDDAQRKAFDEHRSECDGCRDEYSLVEEIGEACLDAHEPPPADFASQVVSAVRQAEEADERKSRAIPTLLACLALQIVGIVVFRHGVMRLIQATGEIATLVLRDWIFGFFVALYQYLTQATSALPTSSLPFALDWTLGLTILAITVGLFALTIHRASHDNV